MPSSFLPSWLSLSTPHLKTSDVHILDLTMTVQLLEQSTSVHAMVSEALLENPDIVGECWNCTWGAQRKSLSQSQGPHCLLTGPLSCQQNQRTLSWSPRWQSLINSYQSKELLPIYGKKLTSVVKCKLLR